MLITWVLYPHSSCVSMCMPWISWWGLRGRRKSGQGCVFVCMVGCMRCLVSLYFPQDHGRRQSKFRDNLLPLSVGFSRQEYWSWVAMFSSRRSSWLRDRNHLCLLPWQVGCLPLAPLKNIKYNKEFSLQRIAHFNSPWCCKDWEFWQIFS